MMSSTSNLGNFSSRRSSRPEVFYKQGIRNDFEKFLGKQAGKPKVIKKDYVKVVFYKFCNILNRTSFVKQIRTAVSEHS